MYATTRELVQALEKAGELSRIKARVSPILEITELADRQSKSAAPHLPSEATRKTDPRFHHRGGKALLFENVEGSDIPVVINQFGSYYRMEVALGCNNGSAPSAAALGTADKHPIIADSTHRAGAHAIKPGHTPGGLESLAARIGALTKPEPPITLIDKIKKIPELLELAKLPPKVVKHGLCQEVVHTGEQIDLKRLPLIRCWPLDGDLAAVGHPANANDDIPGVESGPDWNTDFRGRYVTLGGVHTIHRDDLGHPAPPSRNIGMYRVQLLGKRHMAMHWHMHHDGARHWRSWRAKGEKMPVAIALGGESVLPYAATAPMPPGMSELLLAGFLNRSPIPLVRCKTIPIDVPANSEIVIEGYVDTEPSVLEGPFGDHTGFYSLPDRYPLLEVTAITHRRDPIYPTTVVGLPPQEDYFLGKATERLFLPLLRTIIPDVIDYDLPMFGAFHNCAFVQIRKEYPLQARRIMSAIWGAGQMSWTKTIVVVDPDVDVHDTEAVMKAVGERCHPQRDVMVVDGPLDILDHAAPYLGAGGKIGFDATVKRDGEQGAWPLATPIQTRSERRNEDDPAYAKWMISGGRAVSQPLALGNTWLLVSVAESSRQVVDRIAAEIAEQIQEQWGPGAPEECRGILRPNYVLILGPDVDVKRLDDAFFHWCANFDPKRDRVPGANDSAPGTQHSALIFDATPKKPGDSRNGLPCRDWPPILRMSSDVVDRVTRRSSEYLA